MYCDGIEVMRTAPCIYTGQVINYVEGLGATKREGGVSEVSPLRKKRGGGEFRNAECGGGEWGKKMLG